MKKTKSKKSTNQTDNQAMSEQLRVTRVVRKVRLMRCRERDEKWALIIRTDSNSEAKNMEFFTLVDSITFDTYPEIRPGMTVTLCYYPEDVHIKKGNTIIHADEIWIKRRRNPKGEKRKVQPYYYPSYSQYYTFEGEMPEKSKNDEMLQFDEEWMQE